MKNIDCFAFSEKDIVPSNLVTMNIELKSPQRRIQDMI